MEHNIANLRGSIVAIVTPFNQDGSVDYVAYERLINFHAENGTDAIVVCGTTGETPSLSEKEYRELIRFTVLKVNKRIPVIAGSGGNATEKTLQTSQVAIDQGVDGLLIVSPYYNKPTVNGMYRHFEYLAQRLDVPIILYNVPGRTGSNMPSSLTLRLARDFKNIVAVKEASGNLVQISEIIAARPEGFKVYSGDDALALPVIALGGDGCISVVANEIPAQFSQLVHAALDGRLDEARRLHNRYLRLMNLNFTESNPIPVKTALFLMGMVKEQFRLPLAPAEDKTREILRDELERLGLVKPLQRRISIPIPEAILC